MIDYSIGILIMYAIIYMNFDKKNPVIVHSTGIESEDDIQKALEKDDNLLDYEKKAVSYTVNEKSNKLVLESLGDQQGWRRTFLQDHRERIEQALSTTQLIQQLKQYSTNKQKEANSGGVFANFKARFSQAFKLGQSPQEKAEAADALIAALKDPKKASEIQKHHVRSLTSGTLAKTVKQAPHVYEAVQEHANILNEKPSNSIRPH